MLKAFKRQKDYTPVVSDQKLHRILNTIDVLFLGVGSTLGAGVYVITADIAQHIAGPAAVISILFGFLIFLPSAMCYAEFASRMPKAGSAYAYTYVTFGEIIAFLVGWNMLLEYLIGAAAIARTWSSFVDSLTGNEISGGLMTNVVTWKTPGISRYPDFMALGVCILTSLILVVGVKISCLYNMLMTFVNLIIIVFIFLMSIALTRLRNWKHFSPFGLTGILTGSKVAFFTFVGIEVIAASAEETKNPASNIPKAIFFSLLACLSSYIATTISVTLLVNFKDIRNDSSIPEAFFVRGIPWLKYVIAVGVVAGLSSSLIGTMFTVPRLLYTMATDGLLFFPFAGLNKTTKTPIFSTLFSGIACGWLSLYFELSSLIEIMTIGTLQAYTMVAACVLLLRYQVTPAGYIVKESDIILLSNESIVSERENIRMSPTKRTFKLVAISMMFIIMTITGLAFLLMNFGLYLLHGYFIAIVFFFLLLASFTIALTVIALQPQNVFDLPFKVPLVPIIPVAAIFINIFFMMSLSGLTWARFGLWMIFGMFFNDTHDLKVVVFLTCCVKPKLTT